jgi:hypothetical protein
VQAPIDVLQIGLTDNSERVWRWSFDATKECGFGVKSSKDIATAVRGRCVLPGRCVCVLLLTLIALLSVFFGSVRLLPFHAPCSCRLPVPFYSPPSRSWLLFAGDSQIRMVFRRLTDSVSEMMTKEFGPPTINGEVEPQPSQYPFFGHKDFEVVWTERAKDGPVTTRCASAHGGCSGGKGGAAVHCRLLPRTGKRAHAPPCLCVAHARLRCPAPSASQALLLVDPVHRQHDGRVDGAGQRGRPPG